MSSPPESSLAQAPLRRPLPAASRWSRKVFGALLIFSALSLVLVVLMTFIGSVQKAQRSQAEQFQDWLSWRQAHCRFEGRLESGTFVCDNGQRFPVQLTRGKEVDKAPQAFRGR